MMGTATTFTCTTHRMCSCQPALSGFVRAVRNLAVLLTTEFVHTLTACFRFPPGAAAGGACVRGDPGAGRFAQSATAGGRG